MLAANQNYNLSQCSLCKRNAFALVEVTGCFVHTYMFHCLRVHFPDTLLSIHSSTLAICGTKRHSLHSNTLLTIKNLLVEYWWF